MSKNEKEYETSKTEIPLKRYLLKQRMFKGK
jgi:hypothetical protein